MNNTNPSQLRGINPISMNMKVYEANLDKSTPVRRLSTTNGMIEGVDEADASLDKVSSLLRRDRSGGKMELTPHTNNPDQNRADSPQLLDANNSN